MPDKSKSVQNSDEFNANCSALLTSNDTTIHIESARSMNIHVTKHSRNENTLNYINPVNLVDNLFAKAQHLQCFPTMNMQDL